MATEIERKFLLDEPPEQIRGGTGKRIEQGYLTSRESVEVRLRKVEDQRLLTAKLGHGEARVEVEIPLGTNQFDALWPLTEPRRLRKTRYLVPLGDGLEAEVDVYEGDLAGLVTAEVEFGFERQSQDFQPPAWLGDGGHRRPPLREPEPGAGGLPLFSSREDGKSRDMPSRSYRLKTKEAPAEGLRRIALGRTEKAVERLDGVEGDELAAAIHGARKDLKKLRGALRLVRFELGKKKFKAESRRYRDAGRLLSGSRDAEVKLETLAHLHQRSPHLPGEAVERWEGMLETERDELAAAARETATGRSPAAIEAIEKGRGKIRRVAAANRFLGAGGTGAGEDLRRRPAGAEARAGATPPPRTSTSGASGPRTSGTSCGSSAMPGRSCWARRSTKPTSSPTCSATTMTWRCWQPISAPAPTSATPPPSRPRSSSARRSFSTRRSRSADGSTRRSRRRSGGGSSATGSPGARPERYSLHQSGMTSPSPSWRAPIASTSMPSSSASKARMTSGETRIASSLSTSMISSSSFIRPEPPMTT